MKPIKRFYSLSAAVVRTFSSIAQVTFGLDTALEKARRRLYAASGGSYNSADVRAARITGVQRLDYFRSPEFVNWVRSELAAGRQVFWLKDVDKTQAAGDVFSFFFKWRADNNKFTPSQLEGIAKYFRSRGFAVPEDASQLPHEALRLWLQKTAGGDGIGLMEFWSEIYWPTQMGLTEAEKLAQVTAFAPTYACRVYPGVAAENRFLESLGVTVVIVSNGDQELARAIAPILGINPQNAVGSNLLYENGLSTGVIHSYEMVDEDWDDRPQPGKALNFHYWLHINRARWSWSEADEGKFVIAGRDGDSASADGGMMIYLQPAAIGNFIVDTPAEPNRAQKFYRLAAKYGWTRGQFITLVHSASERGFQP